MNFADGDGFLDVIIYIVIMVVGLAASAYRNYTKRKEAERMKEEGEINTEFPELDTEPVIGEEIYDQEPFYGESPLDQPSFDAQEILGTNQPVVPEPVVQTISKASVLDKPVSEVEVQESLIDTVPNNVSTANLNVTSDADFQGSDDIFDGDLARSEIHDSIGVEELSEFFDARKAIIYSEIINRKYI